MKKVLNKEFSYDPGDVLMPKHIPTACTYVVIKPARSRCRICKVQACLDGRMYWMVCVDTGCLSRYCLNNSNGWTKSKPEDSWRTGVAHESRAVSKAAKVPNNSWSVGVYRMEKRGKLREN
jgi:hypothetical protein